ncbi:pilus assembly protein PilM [Bacillus timonensis]|nr:pilus assembly protein PilM [Bacillus timonensis]
MVLSLLTNSKKIANIIIKDHVIRYVGSSHSSSVTIQKYRERYLPTGIIEEGKILDRDSLRLIMEECVEDWDIKKKPVRFVIPDASVFIRKTSIPKDVNDDEIMGYLYLELGSTIHLPFEDPVIDFQKLTEDDTKKEVLMFAAPEEVALSYATLLEEASLNPIAADISPLCMYRLFEYSDKVNANHHSMLIQFDLQAVNLSIFHNHIPVFMRDIALETSIDDWDISPNRTGTLAEINWVNTQNNIEPVIEDLLKEIEHVLNFYHFSIRQGKDQIDTILFGGDHPYSNYIISKLTERYEMPVITLAELNDIPSSYFLPLGLALKEVQ